MYAVLSEPVTLNENDATPWKPEAGWNRAVWPSACSVTVPFCAPDATKVGDTALKPVV